MIPDSSLDLPTARLDALHVSDNLQRTLQRLHCKVLTGYDKNIVNSKHAIYLVFAKSVCNYSITKEQSCYRQHAKTKKGGGFKWTVEVGEHRSHSLRWDGGSAPRNLKFNVCICVSIWAVMWHDDCSNTGNCPSRVLPQILSHFPHTF